MVNTSNRLSNVGNGEQMNVSYNALNHVVHAGITTAGGSSSVEYVYDHDGIRVGKTINGSEVIRYVVDKNRAYAQVLEEQRTQGGFSATTSYVYGDDLISRSTAGITQYYHYDGLNSVRALSDPTGTLTDTYLYDAYGQLLDSTGTTTNPYLYRGEQYDPALSAYYLRARYYQPGLGRFLTTDPEEGFVLEAPSLHRYIYGNCDPIHHFDPSGEVNLNELAVNTAIANVLVGISLSQFDYFKQMYADFGEKWLPDAYIVGATGIWSKRLLEIISATTPQIPYPPEVSWTSDRDHTRGVEVLFSITSAQIAGYAVLGGFMDFSRIKNPSEHPNNEGYLVYQGYVWNLWNTKDYEGWFAVAGLSIGSFGGAVFCDLIDRMAGPWGLARNLFGKEARKHQKITLSGFGGLAYYHLGTNLDLPHEFIVGGAAVACSTYFNLLSIQKQNRLKPSPIGVAFLVLDITLWTQTTFAKYHWNHSPGGYNIHMRQTIEPGIEGSGRPDDFQSGPGFIILNRFL